MMTVLCTAWTARNQQDLLEASLLTILLLTSSTSLYVHLHRRMLPPDTTTIITLPLLRLVHIRNRLPVDTQNTSISMEETPGPPVLGVLGPPMLIGAPPPSAVLSLGLLVPMTTLIHRITMDTRTTQ